MIKATNQYCMKAYKSTKIILALETQLFKSY